MSKKRLQDAASIPFVNKALRITSQWLDILRDSLFGGQIVFPAVQNPSSDPNTLDDYEEGVWTPKLQDASRSDAEGQTYSVQVGWYTKVGNVVTVGGRLITTSIGTLSGSVVIAGLPFTSNSTANHYGALARGFARGMAITAGHSVGGFIEPNETAIGLDLTDATTGGTTLVAAEWSNTGDLAFSATYHT